MGGGYMTKTVWTPSAERVDSFHLSRFADCVRERYGARTDEYESLGRWSVDAPEKFWQALVDFTGIVFERGEGWCSKTAMAYAAPSGAAARNSTSPRICLLARTIPRW